MQMPSHNRDLFGMDFLISSGNHVESYLSYAAHHVPVQIEHVEAARRVFILGERLLVSGAASSKMNTLNKEQDKFITDEATLMVCNGV